ncbi:kynurenine 3-monooxygenase [Favolaschia claudopus]|uniref:Kynurenine 3-monooxygenase n=1 Tax=Favolaschia claudopus TaxID=2862362 RepID=A0AAW0ANP9_9AGAR
MSTQAFPEEHARNPPSEGEQIDLGRFPSFSSIYSKQRTRKAVVVGAGPVGCLAAISLARRGWEVTVFEGRSDLRAPSSRKGQLRSINLAISHRGLAAIQVIDPLAAQRFLQTVIPMKGRMIHHPDCSLDSQLYDRDGQCINSIDRALLNESLLDNAASSPNIRLFFQHKVQFVDFDKKTMTVLDVRMDFQQEYLRDEYVEFRMPAGRDSNGDPVFVLDPDHLHIWPRHSFMFIALPNKDRSFTCTLFAPTAVLVPLADRDTFLTWFKKHFPDALELIGQDNLSRDWAQNPRSPLICTKSNPYHYLDRAILLGDSAHSMAPFYGQGLNCGLEDVRVLDALLEEAKVAATTSETVTPGHVDQNLAGALARYSETRHDDLVAICDLAMANYVEMRHSVTTPAYIFRKTVDAFLYSVTARQKISLPSMLPLLSRATFASVISGWLPLYTMVTFRPDVSYSTAMKRAERQSRILTGLGWAGTGLFGAVGVGVMGLLWRTFSRQIRKQ